MGYGRKAEFSDLNKIILVLLVFAALFPLVSKVAEFMTDSSDDGLCQLSLASAHRENTDNLKDILKSSPSSLSCTSTELGVLDPKISSKEITNELYTCWSNFGFGEYKLALMDFASTKTSSNQVCFVCSNFKLEEQLHKQDLLTYLKEYPKNQQWRYYDKIQSGFFDDKLFVTKKVSGSFFSSVDFEDLESLSPNTEYSIVVLSEPPSNAKNFFVNVYDGNYDIDEFPLYMFVVPTSAINDKELQCGHVLG